MNDNGLSYIDLFAGAGGLSEGFIQSGYRPIAHVEMNEYAARTIETRIAYYYLIDILFVCVDKEYQGKGYARHLVEAAKKYAEEESVPLLFDTDMERYAQIYQHYGCELYNQTLASNGVTRYNLVWTSDRVISRI